MSEVEDIWGFLSIDDEIESTAEASAEEAAMQVGAPAEWQRAFDDPARREVATAEQDLVVLIVSEDEDDGVEHRGAERELDVAELLERQHLAFRPSTEEPSR